MHPLSSLSLLLALAGPAASEEAFVEANILGIFYHELGHAVIDVEAVPIFGQEEDAADVFSIYLIHSLFEEEDAQDLAYDAAFGFWLEAEARLEAGDEVAWWGEHGADEQRFYNTVCLFYGGDPEARAEFAEDLGLPEDRAEICPEEFDQADASWGAVLDEMFDRGPGKSLALIDPDDSLTGQILQEEVRVLNESLSLSAPLSITIESCGEANAFYDPGRTEIVMCTELEEDLAAQAERL